MADRVDKTAIESIELQATDSYRHPHIKQWNNLLTERSFTCFVCMERITGGATECAEHMMVRHFRAVDDFLAHSSEMGSEMPQPRVQNGIANRSLTISDLRSDPTRIMLTSLNIMPRGMYKLQLKLCRGLETNGYYVGITNKTDKAMCLGPVMVFTRRTISVLNTEMCTLLPGEKFKLMITKGVMGPCHSNTFLVTFCTETELEWEYHKYVNNCCGQNSGNRMGRIKSTVLCENLLKIMRPRRDYRQLRKILFKYRQPGFKLTTENYTKKLRIGSNMEQIEKQLELEKYEHLHTFHVNDLFNGTRLTIRMPYVKRYMPALSLHDSVLVSAIWSYPTLCQTSILEIQSHAIVIKYHPSISPFTQYLLRYCLGTITFDLENCALNFVQNEGNALLQHLFPSATLALRSAPTPQLPLHWQNIDIVSNAQQMQAVQEIVHRSTHLPAAAPYLLYGPPGTGKTKTLIEAVYQVLQANRNARILLCTSTNAAADELMLRLVRVFPHQVCPFDHGVYRVLKRQLTDESPDHWRSSGTEMFAALVGSSNYLQRKAPASGVLRQYSVVVCTLTMAGLLAMDNRSHFTEVFIDECGSATETATLVALRRGWFDGRMTANVVLAGDPKQLGPVLQCEQANSIGYGESLLERLMSHPAYARDPTTKRYPAHLATKLVQNYRSHPAIIAPSNRLFYDNELVAVGPPERTHRFVHWDRLPNPKVPVIFHALYNTHSTQGDDMCSWSNRAEMNCITDYIRQLLASGLAVQRDIAVITPYRRQQQQMTIEYADMWPEVIVSTVERFQGNERPVVLVSTVRSRQNLGFVRDPKRLNVMLTRAQGLQIVVGDPLVLKTSRHWHDVLAGWMRSGVCVGNRFEVDCGLAAAAAAAEPMEELVEMVNDLQVRNVVEEEEVVVEEEVVEEQEAAGGNEETDEEEAYEEDEDEEDDEDQEDEAELVEVDEEVEDGSDFEVIDDEDNDTDDENEDEEDADEEVADHEDADQKDEAEEVEVDEEDDDGSDFEVINVVDNDSDNEYNPNILDRNQLCAVT